MKSISILKKLIIFYYYFAIFGILVLTIGFPIVFNLKKNKAESLVLNFMDMNIDVVDMNLTPFIIIILIGVIIIFQLLRGIYYFKKSLNDLANGNYFSELVVNNFKKTGKCFLIFGFGQWIYRIIIQIVVLEDLKLGINNTLFLATILGLFFLFLSDAFAKAKETKQENDLTI
ncbi:DUF2975 domain-containing protein [Polaribacter aquimarinus]|uniref:DUF2975 domain-containing protein n=2 Tax=Polaribacter TaxID=52959 RepID=A0A2U2JBM3_9FLAO|nr:DUF2975 domain-containing protein [Polaribacter aquimarinus]PWG05739.1 hypothetical protein DIS07_04645 [Polaribacter aquimarinus]